MLFVLLRMKRNNFVEAACAESRDDTKHWPYESRLRLEFSAEWDQVAQLRTKGGTGGIRYPEGTRDISLLYNGQIDFGAHSTS
jgi:hypothetical protein